jgi:hypothetical protein
MTDECRDSTGGQLGALCVVPSCPHCAHQGHPCACCAEAFGPMLRETTGTAGDVEPESTAVSAAAEALAAIRMHRKPVEAAAGERRQGQTCWLCTQRRTCTMQVNGWECDDCLKVL